MYKMIFRRYANEDTNIKFLEIENGDLRRTIDTIKDLVLTNMIGE